MTTASGRVFRFQRTGEYFEGRDWHLFEVVEVGDHERVDYWNTFPTRGDAESVVRQIMAAEVA